MELKDREKDIIIRLGLLCARIRFSFPGILRRGKQYKVTFSVLKLSKSVKRSLFESKLIAL